MWMNEHDITGAQHRAYGTHRPRLVSACDTLANLRDWTNANSDGWPYWKQPSNAAKRLMDAVEARAKAYRSYGSDVTEARRDITDAELAAALRPIKAFLTRHGVDHADIIVTPITKD
jgi:hypothetical protein